MGWYTDYDVTVNCSSTVQTDRDLLQKFLGAAAGQTSFNSDCFRNMRFKYQDKTVNVTTVLKYGSKDILTVLIELCKIVFELEYETIEGEYMGEGGCGKIKIESNKMLDMEPEQIEQFLKQNQASIDNIIRNEDYDLEYVYGHLLNIRRRYLLLYDKKIKESSSK